MGDKDRLLTKHKQKAYMTAIIEIARSIIGRCENGGHVELPKVTMETMKQADALLTDWSDDEDLLQEVNQEPGQEVKQEPGQEVEQEPGQEQEPEEELHDVLESGQEEIEMPESEKSILQDEVLQEWPYTQTSVQYLAKDSPHLTRGLTSSYVRPVLAAFLQDSSLSLSLQSSYYQVVQQQGQDVALSDGSTVVLAKLSHSLLETLADIQLLNSVIAVHEATGHPARGDLVLVSFSSLE